MKSACEFQYTEDQIPEWNTADNVEILRETLTQIGHTIPREWFPVKVTITVETEE